MIYPADEPDSMKKIVSANEKRLRALVAASSDVIYSLSADWSVMYELDGRGFLKNTDKPMTGWRQQNVYAADMGMVNTAIDEAIRGKKIFELEHRVNRTDGTMGWTLSRAVPILDNEGNIEEWFGTASDITDRKLAEEKLSAFSEQLRLATESAELGTWFYEPATGRLETSDRCKTIYDLSPGEDLTYKLALNRISGNHRKRIGDAIETSLKYGSNFNVDYPINIAGKKDRWVRSVGKVITDEQGLSFMTGVMVDITEQKTDEARKNDFIGMVSHELKTPLTSLMAIIQVASKKLHLSDDAFLAGAMEKAGVQVKRMSAMINGFLNVSRLKSGKITIEKQDFHLHELIKEIVAEFEMTSSNVVEVNDCDDVSVSADRGKIGSVLSNLISNAIKYSSRQAQVTVNCKLTDAEVIISVRDKGIGIAAEDIVKIFDRYYRAATGNVQYISGFGIGLYLSAEIIHRHDGRIWAESEPGKGSTFYFSLPFA